MRQLLISVSIIFVLASSAFADDKATGVDERFKNSKPVEDSSKVPLAAAQTSDEYGPWERHWGTSSVEQANKAPAPSSGRYQIFMSPLLARDTFLVDTWSGDVWQLVVDKHGDYLWKHMIKEIP